MTYDVNALIAEQVGLCTILREDGRDKVYVHPLALQELLTIGLRARAFNKATVALVQKLCKLLIELPAAAHTPEAGKLFEETMTLAVVCRVATC